MSDQLDLPGTDDDLVDVSMLLKVAGPVLAFGAAWLVRKALDTGYRKATGSAPPKASDRDEPMPRVILYAAATAAAVAIVNVAIDRWTAPKPRTVG